MSRITSGPSTATGVLSPGVDPPAARPHAAVGAEGGAGAADAPTDGRDTRWADHREARRAELVRLARRAVHHGGPDVSMEEIALAAGTSKSIVYRYFIDKSGLQVAVAEQVVLDIRAALEGVLHRAPTPRDALRGMVAVYLEMIESSPHVYAFVTRDGSVESGALRHFLDSVTALVAAPFARGLTDDVVPPDQSAAASPAGPAPEGAVLGDTRSGAEVAESTRALAEAWAAGAVGFVRGAGERWLAHRDDPGAPGREELTAQVAAWLWAGPVGLLARERTRAAPDPRDHPARPQPVHQPTTTVREPR
ncbi:TetR/AcrR family transcriptional regulator [Cellulomonas hominis]